MPFPSRRCNLRCRVREKPHETDNWPCTLLTVCPSQWLMPAVVSCLLQPATCKPANASAYLWLQEIGRYAGQKGEEGVPAPMIGSHLASPDVLLAALVELSWGSVFTFLCNPVRVLATVAADRIGASSPFCGCGSEWSTTAQSPPPSSQDGFPYAGPPPRPSSLLQRCTLSQPVFLGLPPVSF